jgi:mannosyl-3-phosphoglycerate phosphatase
VTLAVFSDLDGTLLDHQTYSHAPALPALGVLRRHGIPLVLATSKTAQEVAPLREALGLSAPAIVENGAGLLLADGSAGLAQDYARIRAALGILPRTLRQKFTGFGDMTTEALSTLTSLSLPDAARAQARQFSEPGLWEGTPDELEHFLGALRDIGVHARKGGRFLTLSFGATKHDQMQAVARILGTTRAIALGDAPNDVEMLEAADFGVIIRNDHGTPLPRLSGEATGRISRTQQEGPQGWNTAVLGLLMELGFS